MPRPRLLRSVPVTAAWVSGALVAFAVAMSGVALVGRSVTDSRPAPLSASAIDDRLAGLSTTTTTSEVAGQGGSSTTVPGDAAIASTTTTPDAQEEDTPDHVTPAPTSTIATTPSSPPTTGAPSTTTPTTAVQAETRTYNVEGGTVALRFEPSGVSVVYANPNAGFDVEIEPEHGNGVKVEFENEAHRSEVSGWWDGGPQDEVKELAGEADD